MYLSNNKDGHALQIYGSNWFVQRARAVHTVRIVVDLCDEKTGIGNLWTWTEYTWIWLVLTDNFRVWNSIKCRKSHQLVPSASLALVVCRPMRAYVWEQVSCSAPTPPSCIIMHLRWPHWNQLWIQSSLGDIPGFSARVCSSLLVVHKNRTLLVPLCEIPTYWQLPVPVVAMLCYILKSDVWEL